MIWIFFFVRCGIPFLVIYFLECMMYNPALKVTCLRHPDIMKM